MRINEIDFEIMFVDGLEMNGEELLGLCEKDKARILITKNQPNLLSTIKHELTHAYIFAYGFDQVEFDEEVICDFIETYGEKIIKDSKKLYKGEMNAKSKLKH